MQFGLPVGVRDKLLAGGHLGGSGEGNEVAVAVPHSAVGQAYFYQQEQPEESFVANAANVSASQQMQKFSQSLLNNNRANSNTIQYGNSNISEVAAAAIQRSIRSTAFRNLPHLCSFWVLGTCQRLVSKHCPYRPCCGSESFAFPEIAGSHRDLCTALVSVSCFM